MESGPQETKGGVLETLTHVAIEAGALQVANDARVLSERVRDGLFYVACVGQFKRGKSTLLNALVDQRVLPIGVVPVTAVVTVVRHGDPALARVRFAAGGRQEIATSDLAQYVTEQENPENRKGVAAVEVLLPSALLRTGMCLVDTPGIGSVFAGNTEATRAFVPHIDAALVVLGADPPISADELALVQEISEHCSEIFFVLNKADKLNEEERNDAEGFTRNVIKDRARLSDLRFFHVSAAERLVGQGPARDWEKLVDALGTLARRSGSDLVQAAKERGLSLLMQRLGHHLEEQRDALLRPLEETERRVDVLRTCVSEADRALSDLDYLFAAELDRLGRGFADEKTRFLDLAIPEAKQEFMEAVRSHRLRRGPLLRRASVELAQETAMRHLNAWLADAEREAERLYVRAMDRFVEVSNDFLVQLKASGDPALESLPASVNPEIGFRWDSRLFYKDLFQSTGEGPLTWIADVFRTRESTLRSVDRVIGDYLTRLLETNATRVENDLNERALESRRRFAFELRSLLGELVDSASSSLERARGVHARGGQAVQAELERIEALRASLDILGKEGRGLRP